MRSTERFATAQCLGHQELCLQERWDLHSVLLQSHSTIRAEGWAPAVHWHSFSRTRETGHDDQPAPAPLTGEVGQFEPPQSKDRNTPPQPSPPVICLPHRWGVEHHLNTQVMLFKFIFSSTKQKCSNFFSGKHYSSDFPSRPVKCEIMGKRFLPLNILVMDHLRLKEMQRLQHTYAISSSILTSLFSEEETDLHFKILL